MAKQTALHLHGFASSANSRKATYLRQKFEAVPQVAFHAFEFNPTPTDFEYMTITGHINRLRQHVLECQPGNVLLIGSSMGALVGLHYAHRFGGVERLLLLAPALFYRTPATAADMERWRAEGTLRAWHYAFQREVPLRYAYHVDGMQYTRPVPPPAPVTLIHGRHDQVIPLAWSQQYTADFPHSVRLIEVDDDHRLSGQLDVIWQQVESLLEEWDEG